MPIKFIVLAQPRTGSTLVCSLLNSIPGCRALIEPVNVSGHQHPMQPNGRLLIPERLVQNDLKSVMDMLFEADPPPLVRKLSTKSAPLAAGFKIMAHQIQALDDEYGFWQYLSDNRVKVIIVLRYNIVQQYVSDCITIVTQQPTCWDASDRKTAMVTIQIPSVGPSLNRIMNEKQYLLRNVQSLDYRRLTYENISNNYSNVAAILPWLCGQEYKLTTRSIKQNPDDLRAKVTNYPALLNELTKLGLQRLA